MEYNQEGYLQIRAEIAGGALPVPDVVIKVSGNEEFNLGFETSAVTGRSGLTEKITLPTPPRSLSMSPGANEQPYATYDIEASKDGFYSKKIFNIAVFSGMLSILPIQMIPDAGIIRGVNPPTSTNFSISSENEELE